MEATVEQANGIAKGSEMLSMLEMLIPMGGDTRGECRALAKLKKILAANDYAGRIVFLCAEPGMGKTRIANSFIEDLCRQGFRDLRLSFEDCKSDQATARLMRLARRVRGTKGEFGARKAILIDDFPPSEECDLGKQRRALMRIVSCNAIVFVCLRPEASQLMEEMPDCERMVTRDFLVPGLGNEYRLVEGDRVVTYGIPALVWPEEAPSDEGLTSRELYDRALSKMMTLTVRDSLSIEEQRMRLSMLLLGTGDFETVQEIVERLDDESIEWLAHDVPLLGIDVTAGTFSCAGSWGTDYPLIASKALAECCGQNTDIVDRVISALIVRGKLRSAAQLSSVATKALRRHLALTWGVELIGVGEASLVSRELQEALAISHTMAYGERLARWALDNLSAPAGRLTDGMPRPLDDERPIPLDSVQGRHAELYQACRDLLRGFLPGKAARRYDNDDEMSAMLVSHIEAFRLLLSGNLFEAYGLLLNNPARLASNTLPGALLCMDYTLASLLVGEPPTQAEETAFLKARELCHGSGLEMLSGYGAAIEPMTAVLSGRSKRMTGVEAAIARAERMGDRAVQASLLIAAAVADNRNGAYARAHVRAAQARTIADGVAGIFVRSAAEFVEALSVMALGDEGPLEVFANTSSHPTMRAYADLFLKCQGADAKLLERTERSSSRDAAWILNTLCGDFGERSRTFRSVVSRTSLSMVQRSTRRVDGYLRVAEMHDEEGQGTAADGSMRGGASAGDSVASAMEPLPSSRIHISLLGEFSVLVDGEPLSSAPLERRRSKALLAMLAIHKPHKMQRYELVESVWPDADYAAGRQRIYESTSVVRSILFCKERGIEVFVKSRGEGSIGLNPAYVTCDVDQFEEAAMNALAEDDDARCVMFANDAVRLYRGDCCEIQHDALGIYATRAAEIKGLFVDVAVTGAMAAMRNDRISLAVQLSQAGLAANGLREDVALVLIEALKRAGRTSDARDVYLACAKRLLEAYGTAPTQALRHAVEDLFPDSVLNDVQHKGRRGPNLARF